MDTPSTTSILASTEAARVNLPPGVRVFMALRDFSLLDIYVTRQLSVQRIGVIWDSDRDVRILAVLAALVIINRFACTNLIGLYEHQGKIRSWWVAPHGNISQLYMNECLTLLKEASEAALWGQDEWTIEPPEFVAVLPDGKLDYAALPADHPLRTIPARVPLPGRTQL